MGKDDKALVWLHGEIRTPPMLSPARIQAGYLLRLLQRGEMLSMPHSRPMPVVGPHCHELRIQDQAVSWRIFYRIDDDAIVVLAVEPKKTRTTTKRIISNCQRRLAGYDSLG